ncbi:MAG: LPS export ABC transporter permease LptG [Pigmentiphaga sp.]|nr:LPS export ABC transporter permease LptG [Pigmentiphaga sp.]
MKTARRYLAREIYRSCAVVVVALIGLFSFFTLVDRLDRVDADFRLIHLLYLEFLELPTRLYDLLPIGLLIGAILALAGLAQRHELVILRASGVSALGLLRSLWWLSLPLVAASILVAEVIVPISEVRLGQASLQFLGRAGDGRLGSGYWFKEKSADGERIVNVGHLLSNGNVRDVTLYEFGPDLRLRGLLRAEQGEFADGQLRLSQVVANRIDPDVLRSLADAQPTGHTPVLIEHSERLEIPTSLTPELLLARVLKPERMSVLDLWHYIQYLDDNQLTSDRQVVAAWRKLVYPFTLWVMLTIAAPISLMQTRRGGVGGKVFLGILAGVAFFMLNQLTLNAGMLYGWTPWLTALGPNLLILLLALAALLLIEHRNRLALAWRHWWPWRRES